MEHTDDEIRPESLTAGADTDAVEPASTPAAESEPETAPDGPDPVIARLDELARKLDAYVENDDYKTRTLDRLHEELEQHRRGMLAQTLLPLVHGVVRLHSDLSRRLEAHETDSDNRNETLVQWGRDTLDDIERTLADNGILAFRSRGERFDPRRHRAMSRVDADEEQDGLIAKSLRPGFLQGETIVHKEPVEVYVQRKARSDKPAAPADNESTQTEN